MHTRTGDAHSHLTLRIQTNIQALFDSVRIGAPSAEATVLAVRCLANRAECLLRREQWRAAARDAAVALLWRPPADEGAAPTAGQPLPPAALAAKLWFRLGKALAAQLRQHDAAAGVSGDIRLGHSHIYLCVCIVCPPGLCRPH